MEFFQIIYGWVEHQFIHNEIFAGFFGAGVFSYALYTLRNVPGKIWDIYLLTQTTEVTVRNSSDLFVWVHTWISNTNYANSSSCKRLRINDYESKSRSKDNKTKFLLGLGEGNHWFFFTSRNDNRSFLFKKRTLLNIHYEVETAGNSNSNTPQLHETFHIRAFTRDRKIIETLFQEAMELRDGEKKQGTDIYSYRSWWSKVSTKPPKPFDSLIMEGNTKNELIEDVENFLHSEEWYQHRAIPYRRGYMLYGPPGTGKTSFVMAIAGHLQKDIYTLNLDSVEDDSDLADAFHQVPQNAVLLIEDIDAAHGKRKKGKKANNKGKKTKISLSMLLNLIDGAVAPEGRILFVTTNHPDNIDPALIRPGRIDKQMCFDLMSPAMANELFARFYGDEYNIVSIMETKKPIAPVTIQMICMDHKTDVNAAIADLNNLP